MDFTFGERKNKKKGTNAVPGRPAEKAVLVDFAENGSNDSVQLFHAAQAVSLTPSLRLVRVQEVETAKGFTTPLRHIELAALVDTIGDAPRVEAVAENSALGTHGSSTGYRFGEVERHKVQRVDDGTCMVSQPAHTSTHAA